VSAENVELVSALQPDPDVDLVELFRDQQAWANLSEVFAPIYHEDVETAFIGVGQESRNRGVDGFRRTWLEWLAPWETYRADIEHVVDCVDDVLVITNDYGRKPGMTAEVRLFGAAVWTVRDGRIAKAYFYVDRKDALDAVALDAETRGAILARR
jgi:ketosteroid isomerase-like protein